VKGKSLEMTLGFSHPIVFAIPEGIEITVEKQTTINVIGADRALVGQVAAKIRSYRPPEPYLGKGVKYQNEAIRRKAGKAAGK
jgi:large subunit ribosomal protein L6